MSSSNLPPADADPPAPPADYAGGAWPPPPTTPELGDGPSVVVPFKEEYRRVQGNVSDFRNGTITLGAAGVDIQGKIAVRTEIRTPIVAIAFILLRGIGGLIAYYVIEYGMRRDSAMRVGWEQIQSVVFSTQHNRVCLVFTAPNQAGAVKLFSLAFRLEPQYFIPFLETARSYASERTIEGRIPGATSIVMWVILAILVALVIAGIAGLIVSVYGSH